MALPFGYANFAHVSVATLYTASNTVIALATGDGGRVPTPPCPAAWYDATTYPEGPDADANREVTWIGSKSGDTIVVSRGAESAYGGGAASTKNTSGSTYKMLIGWTAKNVEQVEARLVDDITVSSARMGFYAAGSGDLRARVSSGVDAFSVRSGTLVPSDPVGTPTADGLYRDSLAKVWVQFKGTGTTTTYASFNVATVVDHSTGKYTVTFSRPFVSSMYCVIGTATADNAEQRVMHVSVLSGQQFSTSVALLIGGTGTGGTVPMDPEYVNVVCFGPQA